MSRLGLPRSANDSVSNETWSKTGGTAGCCPNLAGPSVGSLPGAGVAISIRGGGGGGGSERMPSADDDAGVCLSRPCNTSAYRQLRAPAACQPGATERRGVPCLRLRTLARRKCGSRPGTEVLDHDRGPVITGIVVSVLLWPVGPLLATAAIGLMIAKTDLFGLPPSRNQGERAAGSVPRPALQACRQAEPGPRLHSYVRACGLGCSTVSVVARADYEGPMAESYDAGRTLTPEAIATWRDVLAPLLGSGSFPVLDLGAAQPASALYLLLIAARLHISPGHSVPSGQPPRPGTTRYAS